MAVPINASMPEDLDLGAGFTVRLTALSTADGSVVSGVNVTNLSIVAKDVSGDGGVSLATGPWFLVPGPGA